MEQSLQMNLSQHLAMTFEMQQAIKILQLSAQDLRSLVEQEYLDNPTLEMEYGAGAESKEDVFSVEDISALADYLYEGGGEPSYFTDDVDHGLEAAAPLGLTLEQELLQQVEFAFPPEDEAGRSIATFIVGSIDSRGYLTLPEEEIARATGTSLEEVREVLAKVQTFEPLGVGARDLSECLRIQAKAQGIYEGLVAAVIDRHLSLVAEAGIREIAEAEKASPEDVQLAVDIVRTLNPKPGSGYGTENASYITPDVTIEKVDGGYEVHLNDSYVPKLHITNLYRQAASFDDDTQRYIKKRLNAATWLINSIEQRRETIRKVVEELVRVQRDFLDKGPAHLKPLTMKEVAEAIEVHESTVSRAVANKYAEIPGGLVALKAFFQTGLKAGSGEDFLASQAKAELERLIKAEDPRKPLSDQKLCELLKAKEMDISRRTVMKYREQLGYPSSVKRKRY